MLRLRSSITVAGTLAAILAAPFVMAQDDQGNDTDHTDAVQQSESSDQTKDTGQTTDTDSDQSSGIDVSALEDGEWIRLTGTVKSVTGDEFTLNYGEDEVVVEMDDYDFYNENLLLPDDKVTISGLMDEDFFSLKSIEASSVYVPKLGEYFYASASDEEEAYPIYSLPLGIIEDESWVSLVGTVTDIDGDEMMIDVGLREFAVDGSDTTLDNSELIDIGDRVSVTGEMDNVDLFDRREIEASSVIILKNNTL